MNALLTNHALCVPSPLSEAGFADVRRDLEVITASDYECPEKPDALTHGTYWVPCGVSSAPGNAVEEYICKVSRSAAFTKATGGGFIGAEWWWQDTDNTDPPKCYHTDCDLCVSDDGYTKLFPAVSSVFYTSTVGGPTIVFNQIDKSGDLTPETPTEAVLSFPKPNQLLLFNGELYHGVLHPLETNPFLEGAQRLTLLVNWWKRRPNGPNDLPNEFNFAGRDAVADVEEADASWEVGSGVDVGDDDICLSPPMVLNQGEKKGEKGTEALAPLMAEFEQYKIPAVLQKPLLNALNNGSSVVALQ